ncbi:hypothetical protein ACOA57_003489 [Vibrio cholerae]
MSAKLKKLNFKLHRSHVVSGSKVKDSIFVELDRKTMPYGKLSYFFCDNAKNVNKRSDLVIYHDKGDYLAILICDLKSSPNGCNDERAKNQFVNSKKFIQYVNDLSVSYYDINKEIKVFYVSFYPLLPISQSSLIGAQKNDKLMTYDQGINSEAINIDSNGEGNIYWAELLKKLP